MQILICALHVVAIGALETKKLLLITRPVKFTTSRLAIITQHNSNQSQLSVSPKYQTRNRNPYQATSCYVARFRV